MAKEIERKFLVANDDWRALATSATPMRQAYVVLMHDRSVRVRTKNGTSAQLTVKIGQNSLVRDEFEYPIALDDAEEMIALAVGNVIEKVRYTVEHHGFVWEIDVYEGAYHGLVIAEVELRDESDTPSLPHWIGREVTGDRRYSNQALATEKLQQDALYGLPN
ncbi:CYTH domain-containing protein [Ciceribacter azotifigens]|uniref:CYTH domain-containing protein n=1 Tax=Ciceribacter azotifigens TaxID=2069303 RepID=UPI003A850575